MGPPFCAHTPPPPPPPVWANKNLSDIIPHLLTKHFNMYNYSMFSSTWSPRYSQGCNKDTVFLRVIIFIWTFIFTNSTN